MDYRNSSFCPELKDIPSKKSELESEVKKEHRKVKIMYNQIKNGYKPQFGRIYNFKCAYCGASVAVLGTNLFEIDHFINEKSFGNTTQEKAEAGKMSNLVFACYTCNRGKSDFKVEGQYIQLLHPDEPNITTVFYRDDNYYIQINKKYNHDRTISKFYSNLKLGFQVRRLNHLLNEISGLHATLRDENLKPRLGEALALLIKKSNCSFTS